MASLGVTKDDGKQKPAAIKVYDFTKAGTDIVDQRIDIYTCSTKSRRWPRKVFSYMLDVTRVNSQSVYALNPHKNPRSGVDSRKFGWSLARSLVIPHMERRKNETAGLQKSIIKKFDL